MLFIYVIRKEIVKFSDNIIYNIDEFIAGKKAMDFDLNKDNLISKVQNKFKYMIEIMENKNRKYIDEKESIKTLISDISHQIKTPIANISMYNETLINRELDREKQIQFLQNMQSQVNKLEWLVKSLIKMSRLENGIISLNIKKSRISDTIANAISGVYLKTQRKNIDIIIDLDEKIEIYHDKRWTSEAFFNIIENAIKYTNDFGHIKIKVEKMEIFTKISVEDSGIGIEEHEINNIFKRFYRSAEVGEIEGVGVGLYLVREIITKQNGYLKVESQKGKGSIFSVYMKN
ncbi:sensor histidine kinase [Paraclostridium sp.]|uniref:sensor histidine kinase n=1 Tax=Paraclostridium sp. TaxID=2023273 RepID=UPI003F666B8E